MLFMLTNCRHLKVNDNGLGRNFYAQCRLVSTLQKTMKHTCFIHSQPMLTICPAIEVIIDSLHFSQVKQDVATLSIQQDICLVLTEFVSSRFMAHFKTANLHLFVCFYQMSSTVKSLKLYYKFRKEHENTNVPGRLMLRSSLHVFKGERETSIYTISSFYFPNYKNVKGREREKT